MSEEMMPDRKVLRLERQERQAREGALARVEYQADVDAQRAKSARLKALREAQEAQAAAAKAALPPKTARPKKRAAR